MPDEPTSPDPMTGPQTAESRRERHLGPTPAARALTRPSRGQVVVGVLLARPRLRRRHPGAGHRGRQHLRRLPRAGPHRRPQHDDRRHAAGPGRDHPARAAAARPAPTPRSSATPPWQPAEQDADTLNILAGSVPVHGPGIRITITADADAPVRVDSLLDTVQELRAAGAEAMEFNDEVRVVAQTSFADGDGGILVDGTLLTSPFVIDVIGEPATLESALSFPAGPTEQLEGDGATVDVEQVGRRPHRQHPPRSGMTGPGHYPRSVRRPHEGEPRVPRRPEVHRRARVGAPPGGGRRLGPGRHHRTTPRTRWATSSTSRCPRSATPSRPVARAASSSRPSRSATSTRR